MSHIEMTKTHWYTLLLFVMNRQMNQEEGRKENKIRTRVNDDAWGVQNEWENEAKKKTKTSKEMLQSIK